MSEMPMTHTNNETVLIILHKLRGAIRAIERVLLMVDEEDIQRKFKQFLTEHEAFIRKLKIYIEKDFPESITPEAIIQFPISTLDLLSIVAKSEKQIIDELELHLKDTLPQNLSAELRQMRQTIRDSYDYTQALADLWV